MFLNTLAHVRRLVRIQSAAKEKSPTARWGFASSKGQPGASPYVMQRRDQFGSLKVMKLARPSRSTRIDTERFLGSFSAMLVKVFTLSMAWLFR